MIFFNCKCPECKYSDFTVDIDSTLEYYKQLFELGTTPVQLLNQDPPLSPEEFVMFCENPECNYREKWDIEKVIHELRDSLSEYAWAFHKRSRPETLFNLEDALVQFFQEHEELDECSAQDSLYLKGVIKKARGSK